jgi:phosphonoacetaldehyde hydrolase
MRAIEMVVLDWAGTAVDFGCLAPVGVFREVFRRHGVEVTLAEARGPMGTHKREHIRQVATLPRVQAAWREAHGVDVTAADVDAMYALATPLQVAVLPGYSTPIPGVVEMVARLRERGITVASNTGYNREMLDVVARCAAELGYAPDAAIAASEVPAGRPAPYMMWRLGERFGVTSAAAVVKVGDTPVDVHEGLNAGSWTVGIARTGNLVGLPEDELAALPVPEQAARVGAAREALLAAGAHIVIDSAATLDGALDTIAAWRREGRRP